MTSQVNDQWPRWPWSSEDLAELTRRSHGQLEAPAKDFLFYLSWRHSRCWNPVHLARFTLQVLFGPDWLRYLLVSSVSGTPKFPQVHYHVDVARIASAQSQVVFGLLQLCTIALFLYSDRALEATFWDYAVVALANGAFIWVSVLNGMVIYQMETCGELHGQRFVLVALSLLVAMLAALVRHFVQIHSEILIPLPALLGCCGLLVLVMLVFELLRRRSTTLKLPKPLYFWPLICLSWLGLAFATSPKFGFVVLLTVLDLGFAVGSAVWIGIRINDRTPTLRLRKFVAVIFSIYGACLLALAMAAATSSPQQMLFPFQP